MVYILSKTEYTICIKWFLRGIGMKINSYDFKMMGNRIKQARKIKRYTQAELSECIDMSPKNMSQVELGLMGISLSTLISICKVLDVSADYILFGIKDNEQKNAVNIMLSELNEKEQLYAENLLSVYVEACKNISHL